MMQDVDKNRILKERALALKKSGIAGETLGACFMGLEFSLLDERYVIDSSYISEVIFINELTPLPCTPSFILGIINLRGKIVSIIDIKKIIDLPTKGITNLNRVIIVAYNGVELGILADEIYGNVEIEINAIQTNMKGIMKNQKKYISGVTKNHLIVLDIKKLLSTQDIIIDEIIED